jgi:hypothetical protein
MGAICTATFSIQSLYVLPAERENVCALGVCFVWISVSKRVKWAAHVACGREGRGTCRVLVGKPEGRRPLERSRHKWEDILKWIFKKWEGWGAWTGLICLGTGTGSGLL